VRVHLRGWPAVLNLNRSAIALAKQRGRVPEKWIVRLCKMFDLDPDWLREGRSSLDRFVEGPVVIISANTKYSPITLRGDELETVRIIGRVLGVWRDFGWQIMSPAREQ